jgi:hypothetical protein
MAKLLDLKDVVKDDRAPARLNQGVVDMLSEALQAAMSGDLISVEISGVMVDGSVCTAWETSSMTNACTLLGVMEKNKQDVLKTMEDW